MGSIWQLVANYAGLTATIRCNGYPVATLDSESSGSGAFSTQQLNPYLVGAGNVLRIEITAVRDGARLAFRVIGASEGDMVSTDDADPVEIPAGEPPHVIEHAFDADVDPFRALLAQAQPTDAATMTAFALQVRDAINSGDATAFLDLARPKFEAIANMMGMPLEALTEQIAPMVGFFASQPHAFEAADVVPQGHCEGKIWDLVRADGSPLIRIEEEDGHSSMNLVAALLPGGPAIVL